MTKENKIKILDEYRELQMRKSEIEKRYKELKTKIETEVGEGKFGPFAVEFQTREVREYVVPARVDKIIKVVKV